MDLDFDKAANRLKKEQKSRVAKEKAKRELDRAKEEEVRKKKEEIEEINRRRRREEEQRLQAQQALKEEEERRTGGVDFEETYTAYPLTGDGADGDRVKLPVSALNALQFKGAMDLKGTLYFSLSTKEGGHTHCSVLEFTADEGVILLPPKVALCLGAITGNDETPEGGYNSRVTIKFVRLEKGTFVRLQPRNRAFSEAVSALQGPSIPQYNPNTGKWVLPGLEGILHAALQPLSALSLHDTLPVPLSSLSSPLHLDVVALEPHPQVSLIDTDISVEMAISKEEEEEAEAARRLQQETEERENAKETKRLHAIQTMEERAATAKSRLLPQPQPGEKALELAIKLPSGQRLTRRFHPSAPLQAVYDSLDAECHVASIAYALSTSFPRKTLPPSLGEASLESLGLQSQESLTVELPPQSP